MRLILAAASLGVIALTGPVQAAEWKQTDEAQSRIYVSAVPDPEYGETGWNPSYTHRSYRAVKLDRSSSDPRLEIYYHELAPGQFFQRIKGPEEQASKFNYLKSGFTVVGQEGSHARQLRMRQIVIDKGPRQCVVFVGSAGDGAGDGQISAGTAYLSGYYCEPSGVKLDRIKVESVLDSIGIKEVGRAAPGRQAAD